jgi:hypothetical protein
MSLVAMIVDSICVEILIFKEEVSSERVLVIMEILESCSVDLKVMKVLKGYMMGSHRDDLGLKK